MHKERVKGIAPYAIDEGMGKKKCSKITAQLSVINTAESLKNDQYQRMCPGHCGTSMIMM